mgnify:CR=1 FL=1
MLVVREALAAMEEMAERALRLELEVLEEMREQAEPAQSAELNLSEVFSDITSVQSQLFIQWALFQLPEQMAAMRAMVEMRAMVAMEERLVLEEAAVTKARLQMLETAQHCMLADLLDTTSLLDFFQTLGLRVRLRQ